MRPFAAMLATEVADGDHTDFCEVPSWSVSQKLDGLRLMVISKDERTKIYLNRAGEEFKKPLPEGVKADIARLGGIWWLDGELVDDTYWVFDCIASSSLEITPDTQFQHRYQVLSSLFEIWAPRHVRLLPQFDGREQKWEFVEAVKAAKGEGVIFRQLAGTYHFGARTPFMAKVKFWKDADVILYNIGREGKRSASMAVWVGDGTLRDVGSVKLTDDMLGSVQMGQIATVKFLYMTKDMKLYQPSILRLRDDKTPKECTEDLLKVHITNKAVL